MGVSSFYQREYAGSGPSAGNSVAIHVTGSAHWTA
ncbi:Uncharacterised protein [Mycobacteroides abscessus subsp. abscessus]|nr:Uncharacterised protein [Mycobacteroides abscessus subsp. abscessus]